MDRDTQGQSGHVVPHETAADYLERQFRYDDSGKNFEDYLTHEMLTPQRLMASVVSAGRGKDRTVSLVIVTRGIERWWKSTGWQALGVNGVASVGGINAPVATKRITRFRVRNFDATNYITFDLESDEGNSTGLVCGPNDVIDEAIDLDTDTKLTLHGSAVAVVNCYGMLGGY